MRRFLIACVVAAPLMGCSYDHDHDDHDDRARPAGYREHHDADWNREHQNWDRHDIDHDRYHDDDVYRDRY
jgi:hypothetical protein